jgi:hypothetical protein
MGYSFKKDYGFNKFVIKDIVEKIDRKGKTFWVVDTNDHTITLFTSSKKDMEKLQIDKEYSIEYIISKVGKKQYNWITKVWEVK